MEKGVLGDGREIILRPGDQVPDGPMSTDDLKAALAAGPSIPISEFRGDIPPMPDPIFNNIPQGGVVESTRPASQIAREEAVVQQTVQQAVPQKASVLAAKAMGATPVNIPKRVVAEPTPAVAVSEESEVSDEGPDADMKKDMILPNEKEKALLKQKYPVPLRVVPIPYSREDGKIQTYILRQLNRTQWRAMEDSARQIAESKPHISANEIFMEKIVCLASVWPDLQEHEIKTHPAGLVPTLFGIVQQMGLFFDPEMIMQVTFAL